MGSKRTEARTEYDLFGPIQIPANCYWGAQTARAKEQLFSLDLRVHDKLLDSIILVKKAAASVNAELGRLDVHIGETIDLACNEVLAGQWRDQFIAETWQSGTGTTLNNNVNEVLANRAEELLGGCIGEYRIVDPHRHVNLGQAANDVFSTAMRLALLAAIKELEPILLDLERLLRRKALEFAKIVTVGRSHLRDTVPVTLGQEFNAFGSTVERCLKRIKDSCKSLFELGIGGTYIGSGFNTHPSYPKRMIEKLTTYTKLPLKPGEDYFRLSHSMADFVQVSSALKELSLELNKIASDLRLLNSGPAAGFDEIEMPRVEPLASPLNQEKLPDQVNPLLADSLSMVCFQVIGNDFATSLAAQAGQLQTNAMMGLIIHNLLQSIDLLGWCVLAFNQKCLSQITANVERCQAHFAESGALLAALSEQIGLAESQALLEQFQGDRQRLRRALLEENLLPQPILEKIFSHVYMTTIGERPRLDSPLESAS